jgi:hypothetical protein
VRIRLWREEREEVGKRGRERGGEGGGREEVGAGRKSGWGGTRIRRAGREAEAEAEWVGGWDRKKAAGSGEGDGAGRGGELGGGKVQEMYGKKDGTGSGVEGG